MLKLRSTFDVLREFSTKLKLQKAGQAETKSEDFLGRRCERHAAALFFAAASARVFDGAVFCLGFGDPDKA